ncbi:MAG: hypothetical protein AAF607_14385 [Pseudomonadota bacterium]
MHRRWILYTLLASWLIVFGYSFFAPTGIVATDTGFLPGLNRFQVFMRWHISAIAFAVAAAVFGRQARSDFRKWLSKMPLLVHLVATVVLTSYVFSAYNAATAPPPADQISTK